MVGGRALSVLCLTLAITVISALPVIKDKHPPAEQHKPGHEEEGNPMQDLVRISTYSMNNFLHNISIDLKI